MTKKQQRRQLRKQSGVTSAYTLFTKEALKGSQPGSGAVQAAAAKWRGMSDAEKQPYVREAAQNRAKFEQLQAAQKASTPMNKRNLFFKQHFPAAYAEAKRSAGSPKAAFRMASVAVNAKWTQQR
eukprot:TRINITY_DN964_c0_g1_i10.p2 TRINITY_DN964_c0_g1~~TRINITY_DN964_c0_g1_i10.p2  ORF type:complete len:125 (+),score=52.52 TRINITY_DN964_c0_g1_i10:441-815(+)